MTARTTFALCLLLATVAGCASAQRPQPARPEAAASEELSPPPAAGSDEAKADLAIILWVQRTRTDEDVARARSEVKMGLPAFASALGPGFDAARHARTDALLARLGEDVRKIVKAGKLRWARLRPYQTDPRVHPAIELEHSPSYPSGHAARGVVFGRVLAELAPEHRAALEALGLRVGYDRVVGGVHWPSDVEASQRIGKAIADRLLADPKLRAELAALRAEEWR